MSLKPAGNACWTSNATQIPDYPSGSYNFIRRLRQESPLELRYQAIEACKAKDLIKVKPRQQQVKLDVAIIGAGVGGLATAIALKLDGHTVSVYEQASALSEVGKIQK